MATIENWRYEQKMIEYRYYMDKTKRVYGFQHHACFLQEYSKLRKLETKKTRGKEAISTIDDRIERLYPIAYERATKWYESGMTEDSETYLRRIDELQKKE